MSSVFKHKICEFFSSRHIILLHSKMSSVFTHKIGKFWLLRQKILLHSKVSSVFKHKICYFFSSRQIILFYSKMSSVFTHKIGKFCLLRQKVLLYSEMSSAFTPKIAVMAKLIFDLTDWMTHFDIFLYMFNQKPFFTRHFLRSCEFRHHWNWQILSFWTMNKLYSKE